MRWQISRGVLAPPNADQPGSAWWRAVNEGLLRDAWQADLLLSGQPGMASRRSAACWIRFLRLPSASSTACRSTLSTFLRTAVRILDAERA